MKPAQDFGELAYRVAKWIAIAIIVAALIFWIFVGIVFATRAATASVNPVDAPPLHQTVAGALEACQPVALIVRTGMLFGSIAVVTNARMAQEIVSTSWSAVSASPAPLADSAIVVALPDGNIVVWASRRSSVCAMMVLTPDRFDWMTSRLRVRLSP